MNCGHATQIRKYLKKKESLVYYIYSVTVRHHQCIGQICEANNATPKNTPNNAYIQVYMKVFY